MLYPLLVQERARKQRRSTSSALEELEALINSFPEVEKSYAIQAGREVRIFVSPEKVDDLGAMKLARDIAKRIEEELKYPGEIKVNVFRETRAVEYAR
jgi:ribonuclease Y